MGVIIRQSIKASISNYLGIGLGFLSLFLLQPLFYDPNDLGAIRLLLESAAVISSFALMGTNYSINRFFPYCRTEDRKHHGFFFWAFALPMVGYLIILAALLIFREPILSLFGSDAQKLGGLYPMLIYLVLFSLYQVVLETCAANHARIAIPNFLREVLVRILIIASGFAFYKGWISFETSVWCMVLSYLLVVLLNLLFISRLTPIHLNPDFEFIRSNPELKKDILRFTAFLFLGGITGLVVSKLDFLMISSMKMVSDTAIYSIGFYLAMLIEIPKRTLLQITTPVISGHMKDENYVAVQSLYRRTTLNQFMAAVVLFYLIWLNVDNLYQIMPRGDFYSQGKWVVFIIGFGRLLDSLGATCGPILANSKFYAWSMINFAVAAVVAISANLILIPLYGINGAAAGTMLTFFFTQGTGILIIWIKLKIHPFHRNKLYIMFIFLIMLVPSFMGKWLHNPYLDGVLRTGLLGGLLVYLFYAFRVSEEVNSLADKYLAKFTGNRIKALPKFR